MKKFLTLLSLFMFGTITNIYAQMITGETAKYNVREIINEKNKTDFREWVEYWTAKGGLVDWGSSNYAVLVEVMSQEKKLVPVFLQRVEGYQWTTIQAGGEKLVYKFVTHTPTNIDDNGSTVGHLIFYKGNEEVAKTPLFIRMGKESNRSKLTIRSMLASGVWMTLTQEYHFQVPHLPIKIRETITDEDENVLSDILRVRVE